jgi:hypothetical protein
MRQKQKVIAKIKKDRSLPLDMLILITELFKYTIKIIICSTASAYANNFLIGPASS